VTCQLRHADGRLESIETPYLLGCDGAHSTVRHLMAIPFVGHAEPNDWTLADVRVEGPLAPDEISVFWHGTGMLAFFPFGANRCRIIADLGLADPSTHRLEPTLADVQRMVDERGPGGLTAIDPQWLANFRINERKVAEYRRGRVMLAGDAAHIHSPAGGQGMNTGMQDAFNLAWKLALVQRGRGQSEPLLQSYSVERSAIGDQVLKAAETFTTVATLRAPLAQGLRNHIAPIVTSFQFVQDTIRRNWWEVSLNYRHSPMSVGGSPAGDRLCYAPLISADGKPATLYDTLDGKRYTLLLLSGAQGLPAIDDRIIAVHVIQTADAAPIPGAWRDVDGRVHEKLHANGPTLVLVRPDGYIGYRGQPADADSLQRYLRRFLLDF
jgi:FAD binding domain